MYMQKTVKYIESKKVFLFISENCGNKKAYDDEEIPRFNNRKRKIFQLEDDDEELSMIEVVSPASKASKFFIFLKKLIYCKK